MVISRSLGKKQKARTNKRKRMRGGHRSTEYIYLNRVNFSDAEKWFNEEFTNNIVPKADPHPRINKGDKPYLWWHLDNVDDINNNYNIAKSDSRSRELYKLRLIDDYNMFKVLSEFEKNKLMYEVLLSNNEENTKRITQYDLLTINRAVRKYELAKKILEAVANVDVSAMTEPLDMSRTKARAVVARAAAMLAAMEEARVVNEKAVNVAELAQVSWTGPRPRAMGKAFEWMTLDAYTLAKLNKLRAETATAAAEAKAITEAAEAKAAEAEAEAEAEDEASTTALVKAHGPARLKSMDETRDAVKDKLYAGGKSMKRRKSMKRISTKRRR